MTLVAFFDFECQYCSRVHETLEYLKSHYGPKRLRVAVKHNPLGFHPRAIPAARAAQAVRVAGGSAAFFDYAKILFENTAELTDQNLRNWTPDSVNPQRFEELYRSREVQEKVTLDQRLAGALGVQGVPAFFINGASLVGARPVGDFQVIIDHELRASAAVKTQGVSADRVYAERVRTNFSPSEDSTPYRVPVGDSPVLGNPTAPVTIVEFLDYECPYCARAHRTLLELMGRYPGKVRWVVKHAPLPNHRYALGGALLSIVAHEQYGQAGFWNITHELMLSPGLDADTLEEAATHAGLDADRVRHAFALGADHPTLLRDADLAADLEVRGTPLFFINGRRFAGAQPLERFSQVLEVELSRTDALLNAGVPPEALYNRLQASAKAPPALKRLDARAPAPGSAPSRGPSDAPVVVQMFSDFECPYCQSALPTLKALQEQFPTQVRVVWRHLPLSFHQAARPAANAAMEAWAQRGDEGFWRYTELLFGRADQPLEPLKTETFAKYAASLDMDVAQLRAAVRDHRHRDIIERDVREATRLGLNGTPAFMINGYVLKGSQPLRRFSRLVTLALADRAQAPPTLTPRQSDAM